jgi:uncharacterized protein YlzI (FlbEa/FlbD family)
MIKLNLMDTFSNGRPVPKGENMILVNPCNILLIEPRMVSESEEDGACIYFSDNGHVAITRKISSKSDHPIFEPQKVDSYNKVAESLDEIMEKINEYDHDLYRAFVEVSPKEKFMNGYNVYGNTKTMINSDFINKLESRGKDTLILLNGGGYYKVSESMSTFEKIFA